MTKQERLRRAYDYLRYGGLVKNQKELATKMQSSAPNVSSALNGVEGVLTNSFIERFNAAFGGIFSTSWLMYGEGKMLAADNGDGESTASSGDTISELKGRVAELKDDNRRLLGIVESQQRTIERLVADGPKSSVRVTA